MGDEERHCLVPGLRREQWDGWQAKIDRYNLSDMKMGRVVGPELNPHHQQSFLDAYNAKSSKILSKSWVSCDSPADTGYGSPLQGPSTTPTEVKSHVGEYGKLPSGVTGMGAQLQTSIPQRPQNTHEPPHRWPKASGTPQTAQPRKGGAVTGQKPHHPPHLKGLISGGVPTETLIVADPRAQRGAGRFWEAKRAPFFFSYSCSQGSASILKAC